MLGRSHLGLCASYAEKQILLVSLRVKLGREGVAMDLERDSKGLSPLSSVPTALLRATPAAVSLREAQGDNCDHTGPKEFKQSQKWREKHVFTLMWNTVLIKLVSFFSY